MSDWALRLQWVRQEVWSNQTGLQVRPHRCSHSLWLISSLLRLTVSTTINRRRRQRLSQLLHLVQDVQRVLQESHDPIQQHTFSGVCCPEQVQLIHRCYGGPSGQKHSNTTTDMFMLHHRHTQWDILQDTISILTGVWLKNYRLNSPVINVSGSLLLWETACQNRKFSLFFILFRARKESWDMWGHIWRSLRMTLWHNWPSDAPLRDADPELRHSI